MTTRKVSPGKATVLTSIVLASTMIGGPALATAHIVTGSASVRAAVPAISTVVSRVSLGSGPSAGGGTIMVLGTNLTTDGVTAKTVKFGATTVDPASVTVVSPTALEVVVPAKASLAKVSVLVGDAVRGPLYTYVSPDVTVTTDQDALDALNPSSDTGLTGATLTGTEFDPATKVLVGGVAAKSTTSTDGTGLTYAMPAGLTGVQDVVVSDPRNSLYVGHVLYTAKTPTLTAVSSYAVTEGTTPVTLTGTNLDAVTAVTFVKDGVPAERLSFAKTTDPTKLVVTVPKGDAKTGTLTVTTKYAKSATIALVRKASVTPTLSAIDGATAAGGVATLTGTNLVGLKTVKVVGPGSKVYAGSVSAVLSDTSAKIKLPALPAGNYTVAVNTLATTASNAKAFMVASMAPTATAADADAAKTKVTVTGTYLKNVTRMVVKPATGLSITKTTGFTSSDDGTTVSTVLTKALVDGTYGVTVTTAFGTTSSATLTVATAAAPAPAPALTDVTYAAADTDASTPATLTLTGSNLADGTHVRYYAADSTDPATDATSATVGSDATSVVLTGDLAAGDYKVEVSSNGTTWSAPVVLTVF